ncbi:MAG TPA: DNA alkylation repair protein [Blastocatellia bacterium]|nr:DNA alkylation repair protein [Blastocatellia bacterium]
MTATEIRARLRKLGNKQRAEVSRRYFKTGPGQYGEGDIFLGLSAPQLRKLAVEYQAIATDDLLELLKSPTHEERMLALLILVRAYSRGDETAKLNAYELYLGNAQFINNWDLVDASAPYIVGHFLMGRNKKPLYALAKSPSLWERRISIISTLHFVRRGEVAETLKISKLLLADKEDLIHKAVGWALREVGKRDLASEESFLREHYRRMPRTMLRYAIERFPEPQRQMYLKGKI